jgi:hypothetical protein
MEFDHVIFEKADLPALKIALRKFGLDIVRRDLETEVLVIRETGGRN